MCVCVWVVVFTYILIYHNDTLVFICLISTSHVVLFSAMYACILHFHSCSRDGFFYPRPVLAFGYGHCLRLPVCVSVRASITLVEQIIAYVRRIVQIMLQATDLAKILYMGHPSRKQIWQKYSIWVTLQEKNVGHAKFQYGHHFPIWPPWAILKSYFFH